eukprot:3090801-Amphidinium_carterae.1
MLCCHVLCSSYLGILSVCTLCEAIVLHWLESVLVACVRRSGQQSEIPAFVGWIRQNSSSAHGVQMLETDVRDQGSGKRTHEPGNP